MKFPPICAGQNSRPEGFPPTLLLIRGLFFQSSAFCINSTRAGVWCLTVTANSDYWMRSCCLPAPKRCDKEPHSRFHKELLHVSDRTGGPAKNRQEKGTVSSRYHFLNCLPVLIWQSDVKKGRCLETSVPKSGYELGDVVSEDGESRAVPLTAGVRPASSQVAQVSALL